MFSRGVIVLNEIFDFLEFGISLKLGHILQLNIWADISSSVSFIP
jgi:hypothetical protein